MGGTGCGSGSSGNPFSSKSSSSGGKPLLESSSSSSGKPFSSPATRIGEEETLREASGTVRRCRPKLGEPCLTATTGLLFASTGGAQSWGGLGCKGTGCSRGGCFAAAASVQATAGLFASAASALQGVCCGGSLLSAVVAFASAVSLAFSPSSLSSSDRIMRRFLANFLSPSSEAASPLSSSSSSSSLSVSSVSSSSELLCSCFFDFCGAGFSFSDFLVSFCGF